MNNISNTWQAIIDLLTDEKEALGVNTVERAEQGKASQSVAPCVMVWLDLQLANVKTDHTSKSVFLLVPVHVFCVSKPSSKPSQAFDSAMEIAVNVLNKLAGESVNAGTEGAPKYVPVILNDAVPLEPVDASSNGAVIAVNFHAQVKL